VLLGLWKVLKCFTGKHVLVIDGKNKRKSRMKCKLRRRSEQYSNIKAQERYLLALSRSGVEVQAKDS
jgi:hypothetical protein